MKPRTHPMTAFARFVVMASLAAGCSAKDDKPAGKSAEPADSPATKPAGETPAAGEPAADTAAKVDRPPARPLADLAADPGGNDGQFRWMSRIGGISRDAVRDAVIDDKGNVYITGYYSDGADLGDGNPAPAQKVDVFVAKYNDKGQHLWSVPFGGKGEDTGNAVALDPEGNVIVVGLFTEDMKVGEINIVGAGSDDAFIAKFDPDGSVLWARHFGGTNSDVPYDVDAASGVILVTGSFQGSLTAADVTLKSAGNEDVFVLAMDADGNLQWVKQFGFRYKDYCQSITTDPSGNIILYGEFTSEISFGGETLESEGNRDLALVKLDPEGGHIWSKRFGSAFDELGMSAAVDPAGNIVITGSFDNEIDFGGGKLVSQGESDVFVARFDSAGKHQWSKSYGSARVDLGSSVASDKYGNAVVGGWFWHKVDFGGGALEAPNGNKDGFVVKLSAKGDHLWSKRFGDRDHDRVRGVAMNPAGDVAVAGIFRFGLTMGGKTIESARKPDDKAPPADVFVAVFGR